ncbi:hypothetical protein [Teredinibacter purpureus]|jgi:hypothetical protein|uniref:hypothetical protein n=1 Tax=Teredinibacter purpureus TaxID=2731756 RepID=UPI0005F7C73A|nr:hypothetical protein [Teredinibacter purpureus]
MTEETLFNVVCTGEFQREFVPNDVIAAFASLAKIEASTAKKIILGKREIKKSIPHDKAFHLKTKLETLGLKIKLERILPDRTSLALALEPIDNPEITTSAVPSPSLLAPQGLSLAPISNDESPLEKITNTPPHTPAEMTCPKCSLVQAQNDECHGCGVIVAKVAKVNAPMEKLAKTEPSRASTVRDSAERIEENSGITLKMVLATAAAALISAFVWKVVAVQFYTEFGVLAWAIGGLIGAAAVFYGAYGDDAAYLCAVMALVAIVGGKYMVASSLSQEYFSELRDSSSTEYLDEMASEMQYEAQAMQTALADDQAMREYMIEYGYVDEQDPAAIDQHLVDRSRVSLEEAYEDFSLMVNLSSGEDLEGALGSFATMEVFKDSFDWLDFIFIFLGISTAYRMASEGRISFIRRN